VVPVDEHPFLRPEAVPEQRPLERLLNCAAPCIGAAARSQQCASKRIVTTTREADLALERELRLRVGGAQRRRLRWCNVRANDRIGGRRLRDLHHAETGDGKSDRRPNQNEPRATRHFAREAEHEHSQTGTE
jgi:hypothetical protein